ncbi:MAG: tetratricopeptide repeat protein [Cyanobacteria bacterium P01_A01_bin.135]
MKFFSLFVALSLAVLIGAAPPAAAAPSPTLFDFGVQAYQQENYTSALDAFTRVIQRGDSSETAAAYGNRCLVELAVQDYPQAIADCTQGLQLGLPGTEPYLNRGLAYYRAGDYAAALADYRRILQTTPNDYRALYNRGLAQAELGRHAQALRDYHRSLQYSPPLPPKRLARIHLDQGWSHLQLDQHDEAILDFSQAIAYNDANAEAYLGRAYVAHCRGENSAELSDLTHILAIDPTHAKAHFNLGMLRYQQGQVVSAIASFEQAAYHFLQQKNFDDYHHAKQMLQQLQPPTAIA